MPGKSRLVRPRAKHGDIGRAADDAEQLIKSADFEDVAHRRRKPGDEKFPSHFFEFLLRADEDPKAGAADIVDIGEVGKQHARPL